MGTPEGLNEAGTALWRSVTDELELAEHELCLLEQAARTCGVCADLASVVEAEGT
ncbi:hypothetical protein [Nocardiopsis sp. CNR-923]|uniref:hypothetical protein n=1 Tax=Nocardiopsis sp. CNR-923 TaxID=1904965 RepID=UPI0021CCDB0A|nr:hypothetical protein [Nocardiopsis sp. CNR-923]